MQLTTASLGSDAPAWGLRACVPTSSVVGNEGQRDKATYMVHTTPGNIFLSLAAAHSAFGLPPSRQSSNSNRGWRTGLEKETCDESTKVIVRTPQP